MDHLSYCLLQFVTILSCFLLCVCHKQFIILSVPQTPHRKSQVAWVGLIEMERKKVSNRKKISIIEHLAEGLE